MVVREAPGPCLLYTSYDFEGMDELCSAGEITEGRHRVRDLPPRFDFFERHPSQAK